MMPHHVSATSCRFAHIDRSHLYEHVRADIEGAADLLLPNGIVALDDYRSEHTPGVAAATWEAVTAGGLKAICVSGTKFYGTWGDADQVREELLAFLGERPDVWHEVQSVAGAPLVRIKGLDAAEPPQPVSRHLRVPVPEQAEAAAAAERAAAGQSEARHKAPGRSAGRRMLVNVLPPFITKAVIRFRAGRRHAAPAQDGVQNPAQVGAQDRAQDRARDRVQAP